MQIQFFAEPHLPYDGTQLSPHWIFRQTGLLGDALIAFMGPADVKLTEMVDLVDIQKRAPISSPLMLHFLGEWFEDSLDKAILRQHLLACEVYECLLEKGIAGLERKGNDIFYHLRKLTVSIATKSSISTLVHLGININTEGTPIPTAGLSELKINPILFASEILERSHTNENRWKTARAKVLPR